MSWSWGKQISLPEQKLDTRRPINISFFLWITSHMLIFTVYICFHGPCCTKWLLVCSLRSSTTYKQQSSILNRFYHENKSPKSLLSALSFKATQKPPNLKFYWLERSTSQKETFYLQISDNWYWKTLQKNSEQTAFRNTFVAVVVVIFEKW